MRKKMATVVVILLIFSFLAVGTALALEACPKGKINCSDPCHDYIDSNGNSICDRSESSGGSSVGPNSGDSGVTSPENNNDETEPQLDQYGTEVQADNTSADTETLASALMQPGFVATLLLLILALLVVRRRWPLYTRLAILLAGLLYLGFYLKGCMCPVGVLANMPVRLEGILKGQYIFWLILFLLPIVFELLAGRIYCGAVCPFGAIQEFTFSAGTKLGLNKGKAGLENAYWLKYLKYVILLAILFITPLVGSAWWCKIDPFGYLFNFSGTKIALILLVVLITASLFISRFWCRIICPYGALLAVVAKDISLMTGGKIGFLGPHIDKSSCKNCGSCETQCPVNAIKDGDIDAAECINCGECSKRCRFGAIC